MLVHKRENVCFYLPEGLVILKWYNVSINVLSRGGGSNFEVGEGSLEVKLPTIWTDGKAQVGRVREEKSKRKKIKKEKVSEQCFSNDLWLRRVEK